MGEPTRDDDYRAGWRAGVDAAAEIAKDQREKLAPFQTGQLPIPECITAGLIERKILGLQPPEAPVGEGHVEPYVEWERRMNAAADSAECQRQDKPDGNSGDCSCPACKLAYWWDGLDGLERGLLFAGLNEQKDAELQWLREQHAETLKLLESARVSLEEAGAFGHNMELDVEKWTRWHDGFKEREREPKARGDGEEAQ